MPVWLAGRQAVSRPLLSPGALDHLANIERPGRADQPLPVRATGRVNRLACEDRHQLLAIATAGRWGSLVAGPSASGWGARWRRRFYGQSAACRCCFQSTRGSRTATLAAQRLAH